MIDLDKLPTTPGVYIYRNLIGEIIYVGKAINLKKRVSQYFQRHDALGPKTHTLVSQIDSIETKVVASEIEALILESSLIKKYRPKYNSLLKDDKSYLYITISKNRLPFISTARSSNLPGNADIFGPFPNGFAVKTLLRTIRHIFPFYTTALHPKTKCLYCHLGLCPGPDPDMKLYRLNISKIKNILKGRFKFLQRRLTSEMRLASKLENYEDALTARKQLEAVNYIVSGWHHLSSFITNINLPEDVRSQAVNELLLVLKPYFPKINLNRLECFDISQMGTRHFVGSMVVFQNGIIDKNQYRKFKIRSKDTPDDQLMLREVISRRLNHPEWGSPDLIIVDGGKPQVSSVSKITDFPLIGLAKKEETVVIKKSNSFIEINLPKISSALHLLQQLRDEAHRFANFYRRQLMKIK